MIYYQILGLKLQRYERLGVVFVIKRNEQGLIKRKKGEKTDVKNDRQYH